VLDINKAEDKKIIEAIIKKQFPNQAQQYIDAMEDHANNPHPPNP